MRNGRVVNGYNICHLPLYSKPLCADPRDIHDIRQHFAVMCQ